jgi:hypothetical protein
VLLDIVEGYPLLQVGSGSTQLPEEPQRDPQRPVGLQQQGRVLDALSHGEELLPQLPRRL